MAATRIGTNIIGDGSVSRDDLNTTTTGKAVVTKIVQGTAITLSSTGVDSGTGDVTITHATGDGLSHVPATGTGNNLKVLKAGSTANSAAWGAVAFAELTGSLSLSQISATGTPSATTYLRGDGTWATPAGSGGGVSVTSTVTPLVDSGTGAIGTSSEAARADHVHPAFQGEFGGDIAMGTTGNIWYMRGMNDLNYAVRWAGTGQPFDSLTPDGPVFTGFGGGIFGTRQSSGATALWRLRYDTTGVFVRNNFDVAGNTTFGGTVKVSGNDVLTTSSNLDYTKIGTGTRSSSTYLRGDGTWATPAGGSGTVTSVAMTTPTGLTVTGSPITGAGTLALAWSGQVPVANLGTGTASSTTALYGDGTWKVVPAGTVTSVGLTVPTGLVVNSGSPVTGSGNINVGWSPSAQIPVANLGSGTPNVNTYLKNGVWVDESMEARYYDRNDCMVQVATNTWNVQTSGTGVSFAPMTNMPAGRLGVLTFSTGSTATGSLFIGAVTAFSLGSGAVTFNGCFSSQQLSNTTDTYTIRVGLIDSGSGESTDGVFFRYTNGVNSGKFQAVTRSNGTETATDTGVAHVITTFKTFTVVVNAAGTSATFYINGTLVATNTTNIPTGSGRETGYGLYCNKSVGTTALTPINLDFMDIEYVLTTSR